VEVIMMAYEIPIPLRNMMTERDSLKLQLDKFQNDFDRLQDEKTKCVEKYDKLIDETLTKRSQVQKQYEQYNSMIEAMKKLYELPTEVQAPPEGVTPPVVETPTEGGGKV